MNSWMESQIDERSRLDAELTQRAYAELGASVTDPKRSPVITLSDLDQVDGAIKACLKYVRVKPGVAPDDVTQLEERIECLCRPSGAMSRAVRLTGEWYKQAFGALLGKLDTGEQIALLPRGLHGYYYLQPGTGRRVRVNAFTAQHIKPEAVLFYRPLPARPLTMRDLTGFIFHVFDRTDYLLVFLAALLLALIGLVPAQANQIAFGTVAPSGEASLILPIAALLLGAAVSTALIGASRNLVMARVSTKLDIATEAATFARLLSLPPSFFKNYAAGDLASRVATVTALAQIISTVLLGSGLTSVLSLVYVVQIGAYAPVLAFPSLVIVLLQAGLTICVTFLTVRYEEAAMQANAKLSGTVTALLNGIQKVKLAGAEERAFAKWASGYSVYTRATYNRPALLRALPAIIALLGLLGNIVIYFLAGSSGVSIASYMAFSVAFGQTTGAIMELANMAGQIAQVGPMLELIRPIMEAEPEVADERPSVEMLDGSIEMSGVTFRYGEDLPPVLQNLSFKVHPGEYVAIVGKSGCGKSTIIRLLLGFEKPERGSVMYGIHDVRKVDLCSLRRHIGTVMQDGKLFMGDIGSNITISQPMATLDDAWEAAEIAGLADDIRKMPMGMKTLVSEGAGGMSGGQRQRLMIARAVCGHRRILLFDEATSALDNKTQKHVVDSLASLDCTRVVVAHRLSTVRSCDRILVVDQGRIVEEGTYDELIAAKGTFADLVSRQRLDAVAL
ncbi:MAG TPA: NHLP family bacteriocin export ABC transporter permease/ATPase subunit [Eggerthellaceae bacterium]|nr:NHLP family bacteriocin export ABC transporter permease/ATPase subunit [Eggerthellaceae bacterium]